MGSLRAMTWEARLAARRAHLGAVDRYEDDLKRWEQLVPQNVALIFDHQDWVNAITRNIGGGWRVTSFSCFDHMPTRHVVYSSRFAALWDERGCPRIERIPFEVEPLSVTPLRDVDLS